MAPNTTRVPVLNCTIFYWSRRQLNYQLSLFLQSQLQLQLRAAIATDYNNRLQPSTFPAISIPDTCALHALVEVFGSANRMDSFQQAWPRMGPLLIRIPLHGECSRLDYIPHYTTQHNNTTTRKLHPRTTQQPELATQNWQHNPSHSALQDSYNNKITRQDNQTITTLLYYTTH